MKTIYAVYTTEGRIRKQNQDNFYLNGLIKPLQEKRAWEQNEVEQREQIFAVCDGMGGQDSGEVAAMLAIETLKSYPPKQFPEWEPYVSKANMRICRYQQKHGLQMGTTFAGIYLCDKQMWGLNIGDSRILRIRDGSLEQLSKDHTEFQAMVEAGILQKKDFAKSQARNRLTQYLGIPPEELLIEPHKIGPETVQSGDFYMICSDGLHGSVQEEEILRIVENTQTVAEKVKQMAAIAEDQGSRDNITAMLIYISESASAENVANELKDSNRTINTWLRKIINHIARSNLNPKD